MAAITPIPPALDPPRATPVALGAAEPVGFSPRRRAWMRFARNRRGFWSLWVLLTMIVVSLGAELLSNDQPLLVRYEGQWYFPLFKTYPERTFGGDFATPTDYLDPFIVEQLRKPGNWVLFAPNRYSASTR
jgi:microcin C transport system permease protein